MGFKSYKSLGRQNIQNAGSKISALEVVTTPLTINTLLVCTQYGVNCQRYNSAGVLYFCGNGIVQTYYNNVITTVIGNGTVGYSGDGSQAINARIGVNKGINFDSRGNIYITDSTNHVIRKVDIVSGIITTIAGTSGISGNTGNGGQAISALLNQPHSLILDQNDNVYFSCYGSKIINRIDTNGVLTNIAGNGSSGYTGNGGQALLATFASPAQLFLNQSTGCLYVADRFNNAIRKIDLNSGIITTVAGNGNNGSSGDGGSATSALLSAPLNVELDRNGNIYIGEYQKVRKVDLNGIITTIAGTGTSGDTGDGGLPSNASFGQVYNIVFDLTGNLIITDFANKKIRIVSGL